MKGRFSACGIKRLAATIPSSLDEDAKVVIEFVYIPSRHTILLRLELSDKRYFGVMGEPISLEVEAYNENLCSTV